MLHVQTGLNFLCLCPELSGAASAQPERGTAVSHRLLLSSAIYSGLFSSIFWTFKYSRVLIPAFFCPSLSTAQVEFDVAEVVLVSALGLSFQHPHSSSDITTTQESFQNRISNFTASKASGVSGHSLSPFLRFACSLSLAECFVWQSSSGYVNQKSFENRVSALTREIKVKFHN